MAAFYVGQTDYITQLNILESRIILLPDLPTVPKYLYTDGNTTSWKDPLDAPTLVTPTLGVATATSINKLTITAPATSAVLTIADGKTLTASNSLTLTGTDASSVAFGSGGTVVYTSNKLSIHASTTSAELAGVISDETGSGALVFGTSPAITTSLTTPSTSFALLNTTATTVNAFGAATTVSIGASSGTTTINNNLTISGNFIVNGTTTTINATTVSVDDINITLGDTASPTDVSAVGGGITLKGATDKSIAWSAANGWTSSETFNIATGKTYKIAGTDVLSSTTLGSGVTGSSLTSVATIGTGTWQGTVIAGQYGGTGVANTGKTITLGGNLTTSGAFATTFTATAATSLTLPTSGTLATTTDTHYIGTTGVALNRSSANLALTGILSVTLPGSTSGSIQIIPIAVAGTSTVLTLPAVTGIVVTTGDTDTVTNTMLAGSIANAKLTNSSTTIGTTAIALGASSTTLAGLTSVTSTGFTGALTGNADTATTLATSRTIALTGDATASGSFNGSANYSRALTLATVNTNVGQFGSTTAIPVVTVNAKGLVTAISTAAISGSLTFTGDVTGTGSTGGSTALSISAGAVTNANLANSSVTVTAGTGMSGGGAVSLGGTVTLTNAGVLSVNGSTGTVTGIATKADTLAQFAATTSAQLAGVISDETGSGALVFATSPTLVTPVLGIASATSVNKVTITAPATGSTLTIADGKTLTASNTLTLTGTDLSSIAFGSGGTVVYTTNKLSAFSATTSAELAGVLSNETGYSTGALAVFSKSPSIDAPTITGHATIESVAVTGATGTGNLVFSISPTLTGTPLSTTAVAGTNTTQIATTAFVQTAVSNLVASAPATLDTLNELATALGNDANFSTTISTSIGLKAPIASPTFTGTVTVPTLNLTNALAVAYGGTGLTTAPTNGQIDIGSTGVGFVRTTITAGSGITVTNAAGSITIASTSGGGSVTSVDQTFTGGLISVTGSPITSAGTLALTVAGTSGGIPYFSSASTWASSAALTQYGIIYGGGAGAAPVATAAGTTGQVLTATTGSAPGWSSLPSGSISVTGGDLTLSGNTGTAITNATLATVNSNIGTFNNVTVNAKGLVTAASNVSYLTSFTEADTLATVTGRGATTSTVSTFSGGGGDGLPALKITQTAGASTFNWIASFMNSAINTAGRNVIMLVGQAESSKNTGYLGFNWAAAGSNSNFLTLGLHSVNNVFNIFGSGNVMIGTTTDSGHKLNVAGTFNSTGAITGVTFIASGGRSSFSAVNEPFAVGAKYISTGGSVYFGATDGTATPGIQLSFATGAAALSISTAGVVSGTSFSGAGTGLTGTASSLNIGGNATNVTGTVAVANGGTGQTTGYKLFETTFTNSINANTDRTAGMYGSYGSSATNGPTNSGILYNFMGGTGGAGDGGQFWQDYGSDNFYLRKRWGGTFNGWWAVLSPSNYNSYAPTLTGTGASGTWGINITGNAATATTAANYLPLAGGTLSGTVRINSQLQVGQNTSGTAYIDAYSGYAWFGRDSNSAGIRIDGSGNVHTTSALNAASTLSQGGNQVLHTANYNSYAPTLTGGSASGTWGINITGNAATAPWSGITSKPSNIMYYQSFTLDANTMDSNSTGFTYSVNAPYTGPVVRISAGGSYDMWFNATYSGGNSLSFRTRNGDTGTINPWKAVLHDGNYTSYAPSLTGSGASGTWGINVTGTCGSISGFNNPTSQATGSTIVYRDGSGHITGVYGFFNYLNMSHGASGTTTDTVFYSSGDDYIRKNNATGFRASLNVPTRTGGDASGTWGISITGNSTSCSGNSATATNAAGSFSIPGSLTVGNSTSSDIYMTDTDEGTRRIHCNSNRIGFLNQSNGWGAYCDDSGNWFANNLSGTNTGDQTNISGNAGNTSSISNALGNGHTWTGTNYFVSNRNTSSDSPMLQAYSNNGDGAIMAFHRGGHYAINMGLDSDNIFRLRGWSSGFRWSSDASGNFLTGGYVSAGTDVYTTQNYGYGHIGLYSSTIFQGMFAMGDAYKLSAGGGISNLYGATWSYPSAGGIAGNLQSHGMIVAINGGFGSCMSYNVTASQNVTAYSDERLKKNWEPLCDNFVEKLAEVKVGTYERTDQPVVQVGVSAQSLEKVIPEAVLTATDDMQTKHVAYGNAALASAVMLAKEIVELKQMMKQMQEEIAELKRGA